MLYTTSTALQPVEQSLSQLPGEYFVDYSGQFEAQQQATLRLWTFALLAWSACVLLLIKALGSISSALQVIAMCHWLRLVRSSRF